MCGEHCGEHSASFGVLGSSPHVRGALRRAFSQFRRLGIIPACAGSTWYPPAESANPRDHPRMCGEHKASEFNSAAPLGSSPHVRGARNRAPVSCSRRGIIPACAGSTLVIISVSSACRDHPRMCGEHHSRVLNSSNKSGSSPHVRGALRPHCGQTDKGGIIPACAGSTVTSLYHVAVIRDHPRMCGEHHIRHGFS